MSEGKFSMKETDVKEVSTLGGYAVESLSPLYNGMKMGTWRFLQK